MDTATLEQLRRDYAVADRDERLRLLHTELLRPILTVQGVVTLLKQLDADLSARLPESASPEEFEHLIHWLADASLDLQQIADFLTPANQ